MTIDNRQYLKVNLVLVQSSSKQRLGENRSWKDNAALGELDWL